MSIRYLVVVLLLSASLWARNAAGVADGSDWKRYSVEYKVGWIDGFVSAMDDAQGSTAIMCGFQLRLNSETAEGKACTAQAFSFDYEMIKFSQFLDGMDAFYKDFRNTDYPITWAMKLVRDQIRGRSAEDIEKELLAWRQCHADSSKCGYSAPRSTTPK